MHTNGIRITRRNGRNKRFNLSVMQKKRCKSVANNFIATCVGKNGLDRTNSSFCPTIEVIVLVASCNNYLIANIELVTHLVIVCVCNNKNKMDQVVDIYFMIRRLATRFANLRSRAKI